MNAKAIKMAKKKENVTGTILHGDKDPNTRLMITAIQYQETAVNIRQADSCRIQSDCSINKMFFSVSAILGLGQHPLTFNKPHFLLLLIAANVSFHDTQ